MLAEKVYRTVFEGQFTWVTSWWGGGPYGRVKNSANDIWYPSAETIAGRTKWFARNLYWLCSDGKFDHVELEKKVEELFGYGNAGTNGPSMFRISVDPVRSNVPKDDEKVKDVPRIIVGKMGKKYISYLDSPVTGISFSLKIDAPVIVMGGPTDGAKKFAAAMLLTLAYAGIGRAANRGFGRFYPDNHRNFDTDLKKLIYSIHDGKAEEAFSIGLRIIFGDCDKERSDFLYTIKCNRMWHSNVLKSIGNAFNYKKYQKKAEDFAVFGLPRGALKGYHDYDEVRLQSPIIASPIISMDSKDRIAIGVLLIRLYHGHLKDVKVGKKLKPLNPDDLGDANGSTYSIVKNYLHNECRGNRP